MKLRDIGERRILEEFVLKYLDENSYIDEDAYAFKASEGKLIVVNIDTFVSSTDAPRGMKPRSMGWKTVTMTLSDIMAKGAVPKFFMCSLSVPGWMGVEDFKGLIDGIRMACRYYGCMYVGGDLGSSGEIVITGVGIGETDRYIGRSGAKAGDSVWTTGFFSNAAIALHYLTRGGRPLENIDQIIMDFFEPKIEKELPRVLGLLANACIDSSDGLAVSLNEIARMSSVKIIVDRLPVSEDLIRYASLNRLEPTKLAMYCGEEFEFVFTTDRHDEDVLEIFEAYGLRAPVKIGRVLPGEGVYYRGERIERKGWEHFVG